MKEITHQWTLDTNNSAVPFFLLFTYWNGGAPKTQKMYIDDLRLVTSPHAPSDLDADANLMIGLGNARIPNPPVINTLVVK